VTSSEVALAWALVGLAQVTLTRSCLGEGKPRQGLSSPNMARLALAQVRVAFPDVVVARSMPDEASLA